jgi:flagellar motor switch protein FliM
MAEKETTEAVDYIEFLKQSRGAGEIGEDLAGIADELKRRIPGVLPQRIGTEITVEVAEPGWAAPPEVVEAFGEGVLHVLVAFQRIGAVGLVRIDRDLASVLIDLLLGGTGEKVERPEGMTAVERVVLEKFLSLLSAEWEGGTDDLRSVFGFDVIDFATSAKDLGDLDPDDTCVVIDFTLTIGPHSGSLNLVVPSSNLRRLLKAARAKRGRAGRIPGGKANTLGERIHEVSLPVRAILGEITLPVREILELEIGRVLVTGRTIRDTVSVRVGDEEKFRGIPGVRANRVSVRITDRIRRD